MSFASNVLKFEKFNLGDMWKKVKKDPERLLIGAGDPLTSKAWGKALGKDYEPIVDQMGGAYGGGWISGFGHNQDGGVYGRARDAGIDTGPGGKMQDAAHVIAAMYALTGGPSNWGGGTGGAGGAEGTGGPAFMQDWPGRGMFGMGGRSGGGMPMGMMPGGNRQQMQQPSTTWADLEEQQRQEEMARQLAELLQAQQDNGQRYGAPVTIHY